MMPDFGRSGMTEARHRRARELAAAAVDGPLAANDSAWLASHLSDCPGCQATADDYEGLHAELRGLQRPEPPRDLWARTSAALDAVDARAGRMAGAHAAVRRTPNRTLLASALAVAVVVVLAGASLLAQPPIAGRPGSSSPGAVAAGAPTHAVASQAPQAPLVVVNGTGYWIASSGGVYEIRDSSADCAAPSDSCTVSGWPGRTLGSITSDSQVLAVVAPDARQAVVWTGDKIAIVPLATTPQTVSLDLLTPGPTIAPSPAPLASVAAGTPSALPSPPPTATLPPEQMATASLEASPASRATNPPSPIASPAVTAAAATASATAPAATAATTSAVAILDGYEVVGPSPEFSADGDLVAFSARPVDHGTGPDVFVWRTGDARARAVTVRHADLFAGWFGRTVMVNEISAAAGGAGTIATTAYFYDPSAGRALEVDRPMLLAGVDPTGTWMIYWSGSVEFDVSSGLWQPGSGDLYFDRMANLEMEPARLDQAPAPTAPPSAASGAVQGPSQTPVSSLGPTFSAESSAGSSPGESAAVQSAPPVQVASPSATASSAPQLLAVGSARNSVGRWSVKWDASGSNVAVWVADRGSGNTGSLSLFALDRRTGALSPGLVAGPVLATFCFDDGKLVYTSALDGTTYMKTVPVALPAPSPSPTASAPATLPAGSSAQPVPGSSPSVLPNSSMQPGS